MPQSLHISTPPTNSIKRQRSQEISGEGSAPPSPGLAPTNGSTADFADSARNVTVKIPSYLNKNRAEISLAFQDIEWKQRYRLAHALQNPLTSPFRVDRTPAVIKRNRYANVQPWDTSRVRLRKPIGGSDYVNASPITLTSRDVGSTNQPAASGASLSDQPTQRMTSRYIATQGPKDGQFSHFWHMVMQETPGDTGVIVMLTQLYEGFKEKCAQYYPSDPENPTIVLPAREDSIEEEDAENQDDGDPFLDSTQLSADTDSQGTGSEPKDLSDTGTSSEEQEQSGTVTLLSTSYDSKTRCEVRQLRLTIDGESKEIYHYFFNGWPDFGKPEGEDRLAMLELIKVSRAMAKDAPQIVHCSAGAGRTGTWIALDFLLQELEAGRLLEPPARSSGRSSGTSTPSRRRPSPSNGTWGRSGLAKPSTPDPKEEVDVIAETVDILREQRMMMVMNELQYGFLYEVMKDAFIAKYAEKETGPIVIEVQEPSPKVARKRSPFGGMFRGSRVGRVRSEEDTVSEAETEIMDKEKGADHEDDEVETPSMEDMDDPYSAVAPDTIREGIWKDQQNAIRSHEVK